MKRLIINTLLVLPLFVQGQSYELSNSNSDLTVTGTSTLHDWSIEATEISGLAVIRTNGNSWEDISKLTMMVKVKG
jgi:hypothetical protein